MELSKKDRLIITNQLKILEKLYPEEADDYSKNRKAIERGYKLHYDWLVDHLYDEMPEGECLEVLNILDMYRSLTFSYKNLTDKTGIKEDDVKFKGFDGNEETNQYSYTRYFILDLGRYEELTYGMKHPDFNSHWPMLIKYGKMLRIWNSFENRFKLLNNAQIQKILAT